MLTAKKIKFINARLSRGLNKAELARLCGISHSIVTRIENGAGTSPKTAKLISETLHEPIAELFEYRDQPVRGDLHAS